MLVFQYEQLVRDPQPAVDQVWGALGLNTVRLRQVHQPSRTAIGGSGAEVFSPAFHRELAFLYEPEVERLDRWGIDRGQWVTYCRAWSSATGH